MTAAPWYMKDGTREVAPITVDGGSPAFKVRNPQHRMQLADEAGIVLASYVTREIEGRKVTVLSPRTVRELAALGVDMARLTAARPASAHAAHVEDLAVTRREGESAGDWNQRKYAEGMGRLLGEIANARRAA